MEKLFATPDVLADASLQLMTIHKAKGLEFDTVILPGLSRIPSQDDSRCCTGWSTVMSLDRISYWPRSVHREKTVLLPRT